MRVIAGSHRGRPILAPEGWATRPTSDRARETLFNTLMSRLEGGFSGLRVADLFAGTGALGIEALSRGADFALFVDRSGASVQAIEKNLSTLSLTESGRIIRGDAIAISRPPEAPFDILFMDPPYDSDLATEMLDNIEKGGWVKDGGWISVETAREHAPETPNDWTHVVRKTIGKGEINLYQVANNL